MYVACDACAGEKHAWLGDAQDVAEEAFYNFWSVPVFELFLDTIRANQAVGGKCDGNLPMNVPAAIPNRKPDDISWTAAYPLITNWLYRYYGDLGAAKEHWPTLKRYMDGQRAQMADPEAARPHTPIGADQVPDFWSCGDWCAIESRAVCTPNTGPPAAAANFIMATEAMVAMAEALGEMADHAKYKSWLAPFRATYDKTYWNSSLISYAKTDLEVQSMSTISLGAGAVPTAKVAAVRQALVADIVETRGTHLTVGATGQKWLLRMLSEGGAAEHDVALALAAQDTFPGWGYWVSQGE